MDGGESRTFKANYTAEGVALLRNRVKEKLMELMGDYSDDTLAEYVVVLLRNGRCREEATKELHVFLGDDNDAFVSWLWDHLASNLHLYVQPKAATTNDEAKSTRSAARGLPAHSLTSSRHTGHEPEVETVKTTRTHQKRGWGGIVQQQSEIVQQQSEIVPLRSVVANVSRAEEDAFHESHADEKVYHKSHTVKRTRSPETRYLRKRSREVDARPAKRASHPVIDAPRRLLQFAVRDAVRTVQPVVYRSESASKRLRSVVSTFAPDSTFDVTDARLQKTNLDVRAPGATAALRAAAEAAEDVLKNNFSGSVFSRLGRIPAVSYAEESRILREQDPGDGGYENLDGTRAENEDAFYGRNHYSGGSDAYLYDRETEEAAGSVLNSDEYNNTSEHRCNGLVSRQSTLPSSGGRESSVAEHIRGAAAVRSSRLIIPGTNAGSGPRPSEKISNNPANTSTWKNPAYENMDAVRFEPQVPLEKKGADPRKSNVTAGHVDDVSMTDKSKDLAHSSSMAEAQKSSSLGVGTNSTSQPDTGADSRTVFISNVHFAASKDALSRHFNKFGAVLKTVIVSDGVTGQPTGSAYIEFLNKESAEQALTLNGTSFMSRILKVVRRSSTEVPQLPAWPRASRGSPFASRLIRTAYPRPTYPGAVRGRIPLRGGARSFQWKRGAADSTTSNQTTPATPGNQSIAPSVRSFTYTRAEPKPNDGAMA